MGLTTPPPFVSVIVPMRNEAKFIAHCLGSLRIQDYPHDCFEVIVVDGCSGDGSKERVVAFERGDMQLCILENPKRITSTALNVGIKNAKGNVIIILGAHTQVMPDFITQNVNTLERTGADCVGGTLNTVGHSLIGKSIALALSTPFGVGNAKFRYSRTEEYVDTVAYPACRMGIFSKIGVFDEHLLRNQDIEFSGRLRRHGGKILLTPNIKVSYFSRSSLTHLVKQSFGNGLWNVYTYWQNPGCLSLRHFAPMFFVIGLLTSVFGTIFASSGRLLLQAILIPYFFLTLTFSIKTAFAHGMQYAFTMPFVYLSLHISYGLGSIIGLTGLIFGTKNHD